MTTESQALKRWREHCENIQRETPVNTNETLTDKTERIRRARRDFAFFVSYYFPHYAMGEDGKLIESPDFHLDLAGRVKRNKQIKALVRWGRGLAKSVVCDTLLPLWLWIDGESIYLVIVGNNADKAKILLGDIQAEFESNQRLRWDFGDQVVRGNWTDEYFACKERFVAKSMGMDGDARGLRKTARRPNLIICDDLEDKDTVKNPKRQNEIVKWIEGALLPTMDGGVRRFLNANNNFAPRTVQSLLEEKHQNWLVHRVDACPGTERLPRWISKYPPDYYKELEKELGSIVIESEYNNTPFVEGTVFTEELVKDIYVPLPRIDYFEFIVGRWDPAYSGKNDYNAVRVWGLYKHKYYLISCFVRQCKMGAAIDWMYGYESRLAASAKVHWRVEAQFWNDPMRESLEEKEKKYGYLLGVSIMDTPKVKKIDRLMSMYAYYENDRIRYGEKLKGDNDFKVGLMQLFGIEPGYRTHDDSPDADERAVSDLVDVDRRMHFNPIVGQYSRSNDSNSY